MSNVNTVALSGNLTADPELKLVGADGDFAICNLRLAVNRSKKQADGSYEEEASFFDVTVLGNYAKLIDKKLRVGDAITVTGRLEQQRWENQEGEKRSKVVVIANDIDGAGLYRKDEDVPAKKDGGSTPAAAPAAAKPAQDDIPF